MVSQKGQETKKTFNEGISLKTITKSIIASYIITIPIFLVFALILTYTNFPDKFIMPVVVMTTIISILAAGIFVTRAANNKGWLNGGAAGFLYMLSLYLISSVVINNFAINKYVVTMTIIGMLTGAIGGILGINMKKNNRSRIRYKRQ